MAATENITVVFTDLVGSTELASALTPEAADELRRRHFSALRQAIALSSGSEVKNLGDGLMVVFPTASAALACAVAMQQAVHRDNLTTERPLGLRVGLSAGEVTREADDYFGEPVIEASRLCARADAGRILASDLVRAMAGRRSRHTLIPLGELELKGLPEPIETFEVGWDPVGDDATTQGIIPLPARLSHRPTVGVIGRSDELAALESAAKHVAAGEGRQVVFVAGEPGQGKTTLVSEVARRAHEIGMIVILGRCDEEVGAPFRPFTEALSHYTAHAEEALLRSHVAAHGGELARIVPALHQRLGELPPPQTTDADTERYVLYAAAVSFLEEASSDAPLVLVLDDLHWADKPSLQLLRHIVANTSSARLLVLCTYRDKELSAAHPLTEALAALHREPAGVSSLDLKGLDDTGVIAFMESAAGHELDDAGVGLAHELYRETDGNPFFVAEMLRNLSESGAIVQDATTGRWTARDTDGPMALPHSVRAVIGARVSRLGEEATKVLSTASVIGRDFDLDLLVETTKMDEDTLIDLLDEAQRAAVVHEVPDSPGRYGFSHALIQHTLYEDTGATRRTRLHRAVGEAIERLYGADNEDRFGELARHFLLATRPTDADKAISYARRAGEVALAALAPDDAVRYFSQALELAGQLANIEPIVRVELLIGLGTAQCQAGIPDFRATLLDAAHQAQREGDVGRLAQAALANNRGFFTRLGQSDTEKVEVLEAALDALSKSDSGTRARLLATLCSEVTYGTTLERRLALADEAKAMAHRLGEPETLVDVINVCQTATRGPWTLSRLIEDSAEAMALSRALDDPSRLAQSVHHGYLAAVCSGRFDEATQLLDTLRTSTERVPLPAQLWVGTFYSAAEALLHGDATRGEELAGIALEVGTASGQPDALSFYGSQLMGVRYMQGRYGELIPLIADVVAQNPAVPTYKAVLAVAHLEGGDEPSARLLFDEAEAESFRLPADSAWSTGIVRYARIACELKLGAGAAVLFELLSPFHDQVFHNGLTPTEPAAMYLGALSTALERYDDAESYFQEAEDLNARGGMRFAEAHTNLFWGQMLLARGGPGDTERARQLVVLARDGSATRGYASVERRADAALSTLP
ncbi:MAG TPA: AAA family ATPase [Acidimicrobiales bacterium]|nr:AAA family ATPase [Acidimicrobiales bacterium]